jgi:hypothetical protein
LMLWLAIIIGFGSAQRALYPANPVFRKQRMLAFLISPACAMRAADLLGRDLMEGHHPLAVAQACCSAADFRQFARSALLELMHPIAGTDAVEESCVRDWFNKRMLAAATELVRRSGEDLEELIASPQPLGSDAHAYCPRCEMQFSTPAGQCHGCGVALQAFDSAVA